MTQRSLIIKIHKEYKRRKLSQLETVYLNFGEVQKVSLGFKVILFMDENKIVTGNMEAARSFLLEMAKELTPHHGVHLIILTSTGTFRNFFLEEETISQFFRKIRSSYIIPEEGVKGTDPVSSGIITAAE